MLAINVQRMCWEKIEEEMISEDQAASSAIDTLYEDTLKSFKEGAIMEGRVVAIIANNVMVDVGYKMEGVVPREEFSQEDYARVKVGDLISVFLEQMEDESGNLCLSKEKADKIKVWQAIEEIYKQGGTIEGKVLSPIKGGVIVDIGVRAFLPGSQIDFRPIRDFSGLVGKTLSLKIMKMSLARGNVVVSRKAFMEQHREQERGRVLSLLKEGQVVEGVIKNITDYGAFIDLGGIDGLLHITDIAWGRVGHPSERLRVGEKIPVMILKYDKETSRISLGLKQTTLDPWKNLDARYSIGSKVTGRVVNLMDYGVFVEVEPGIEGLIHISDLSWSREIKHPSKVLSVGDGVEAIILNVDRKARKLSLGLKQIEANPLDEIESKYPVGTTLTGKVKSITDFGVFVGLGEYVDGLIHVSDLSWTRHVKHPSEVFKKGQEVEVVVLKIDREKGRISLGHKQLTVDPWQDVATTYAVGTVMQGRVSKHLDFGLFVELENGVEGLVHMSETGLETARQAAEQYPLGERVQVRVIRLDPAERRIALSLRDI